jgi:DMATS type aromatic prenyltransferase
MSSIFAQDGLSHATLRHVGIAKLVGVCQALGYSERRTERAVDTFDLLSPHLDGTHSLGGAPWQSDITDDGTPFEFSVAFHEGSTDLRLLVEPQAPPATLASNWQAGLEVNRSLGALDPTGDAAFRQVAALFAPGPRDDAHFAIWHAAVIEEDGSRLFKLYLNPRIHGPELANGLIEQALARLGHGAAWDFLAPRLAAPGAEARYLSLDLDGSAKARLKVYVGRADSVENVARLCAGASNIRPGDVESWVPALANRSATFDERPILSCFSFSAGSPVPGVTLHVPVRCYLANDADAESRIAAFLSEHDAATFRRVLQALSPHDLSQNSGLITYASLRREKSGAIRVTTYLAPQVYSSGKSRSSASGY